MNFEDDNHDDESTDDSLYGEDDHELGDVEQTEDQGSYPFLPDNPRRDDQKYGFETHSPQWWGLGNHGEMPDREEVQSAFDTLDDVPGLEGLIDEAQRLADSFQDSGFECGVCGLRHGHSTDKHDVRDFFGVTDEFAGMMHFDPKCHCGVNELARLLNFYRSIDAKVFEDQNEQDFDLVERRNQVSSAANSAPIPEETRQRLNEQLGTI